MESLRVQWLLLLCVSILPIGSAFHIIQHHAVDNPQRYRTYLTSSSGTPHKHASYKRRKCFSLKLASNDASPNNTDSDTSITDKILRRLSHIQHPLPQICIVLAFYTLHLTQLTQKQLVFPVQLIPNSKCHFTGLGLDSLAGVLSVAIYSLLVQRNNTRSNNNAQSLDHHPDTLAPLLSPPRDDETPWKLPTGNIRNRATGLLAAFVLIQTYFVTGRFSLFWEDLLYNLSAIGFPITSPLFRSLIVLLGHLTWLTAGTLILKWLPRPPKFFGKNVHTNQDRITIDQGREEPKSDDEHEAASSWRWFSSTRKTTWVWWVIGGYFASSCLFNLADLTNQYILPQSVLDEAQESVVTQLVNPEHNDKLASAVGYIAPCITAPWWEEILYRGFALPLLTQLFGYRWAVFLQGVVFSAHHMSLTAALPLAVLGWVWAIIYTKSKNLWTVILIHALWNSRVFLGSWLGL